MIDTKTKRIWVLCILITLGWLLPEWGPAQNEKEDVASDPKKSDDDLMIQVEFIKLDHTLMTKLLFKRPMKSDSTKLRDEIAELIKEGKAEIAESGIVISKSATRARIESIREHVYPTEFDPPNGTNRKTPDKPASRKAEAKNDVDPATTAPDDEGPKKEANAPGSDVWPPHFFPSPTAFETRNVGFTVEVDINAKPGAEFINITFSAELVSHEGDDAMQTIQTPQGKTVDTIKMPAFYTARLQVARNVKDGAYSFMGATTPVGKDGNPDPTKKYLIFTRVARMKSE